MFPDYLSVSCDYDESLQQTENRAKITIAHSNEIDSADKEQWENVVSDVSMNLHYFNESDSLT